MADIPGDWPTITAHFPGRTNKQVLAHWKKVADPEIKRGSWTWTEDQTITRWIEVNGPTQWSALAGQLPGRISKQVRERWCNHLNPDVKKDPWTPEEDQVILNALHQIGTKWAEIARLLPGRSDNAIKNRWNSTLKKRTAEDQSNVDPGQIDLNIAEALLKQQLQIDQTIPLLGSDPAAGVTGFSMEQLQAFVAQLKGSDLPPVSAPEGSQ
jgi:hypothetical protein